MLCVVGCLNANAMIGICEKKYHNFSIKSQTNGFIFVDMLWTKQKKRTKPKQYYGPINPNKKKTDLIYAMLNKMCEGAQLIRWML